MRKIKAVLKMRFLEVTRNGYEDGPLFTISHFNGPEVEAPAYIRETVFNALCPSSLEESVVGCYDYLVLGVCDKGNDVELKPGDYVIMFEDNTFTTIRGFDNVGVENGKLVLH